jgi:hypothetical protein
MNRVAARTLIIHGGIGLAWLWGDPTRTATPAYQPAIQLGRVLYFGIYPVRSYGLALMVLAIGAVITESRGHPGGWRIALSLWWLWWTLMFIWASIWKTGGIAAPIFTFALAWYSWDKAVPTARSR